MTLHVAFKWEVLTGSPVTIHILSKLLANAAGRQTAANADAPGSWPVLCAPAQAASVVLNQQNARWSAARYLPIVRLLLLVVVWPLPLHPVLLLMLAGMWQLAMLSTCKAVK